MTTSGGLSSLQCRPVLAHSPLRKNVIRQWSTRHSLRRAFQLTDQEEFKNVANGILKFVSRELSAPGGGFYASLDAESEGIEGKFYRWELEEIEAALTEQEYELFSKLYRLDEPPNFEEEFYTPQLKLLMSDHAAAKELTLAELESQLTPIRKKLFDVRAKRERPLLDTKILAAWNGLMIRGYADAGRIFKNLDHIEKAEAAANFILEKMVSDDGRLYRTYTDGQARLNAYLIDYACVIDGLIFTSSRQWRSEMARSG